MPTKMKRSKPSTYTSFHPEIFLKGHLYFYFTPIHNIYISIHFLSQVLIYNTIDISIEEE